MKKELIDQLINSFTRVAAAKNLKPVAIIYIFSIYFFSRFD